MFPTYYGKMSPFHVIRIVENLTFGINANQDKGAKEATDAGVEQEEVVVDVLEVVDGNGEQSSGNG